jgi:osmotically-inducible protein OsmY
VLEGRLSSFYQKQLAQEIVGHIEGVVQVVNQIEVVSGDQSRKVTGLAANLSVRQSI